MRLNAHFGGMPITPFSGFNTQTRTPTDPPAAFDQSLLIYNKSSMTGRKTAAGRRKMDNCFIR
jgi:uncharacterized protein (DUF2141 family)